MFKSILVAYDGSEPAERALDYACRMATRLGARVEVLWVTPAPAFADQAELAAVLKERGDRAEQISRRLRFRATTDGTQLEFRPQIGQPVEQIINRASEFAAELIVMGHHALSPPERWFNSSTTRAVMDRSRRPVLVVP